MQDEDNYCLVEEVSGFGFEYDIDYSSVGDRFIQNSISAKQDELKLKVNYFQPNVFEKQQTVVNFLIAATNLYFVYVPDLTKSVEYYRDVDLISYSQNGWENGYLSYEIELAAKSLFYSEENIDFKLSTTSTDDEKTYDFTWNPVYNDRSSKTAYISNMVHVDFGFELTIYGPVESPSFSIYDKGENLLFTLTFPITLADENEKIYYSTVDGNLAIQYIDADGNITNLYNKYSLEDTIFYKIPSTGGIVSFAGENDTLNNVELTAYQYYKAV